MAYKTRQAGSSNGLGISMQLDLSGFNSAMADYMRYQKRLPADVVNAKLYYIARNSTTTTKAADKGKIQTELTTASREYPDVPLAAILVNAQLGRAGKKGLTGAAMARGVEKFIRLRQRSVNYIRAGWKNAIKILEGYMRQKGELSTVRRWAGGSTPDKETMRKKNFEKLGDARPALITQSPRAWGQIENKVSGGKEERRPEQLSAIKAQGLQRAIDKEVSSMRLYIERKMNPETQKFNRSQGL